MNTRIELRPAQQDDFAMALDLYLTTMQPYTAELMTWDDVKQRESFTVQWKPEASEVIVFEGQAIGWFEAHTIETGTLLQQFFIAPECQGKGIGTQVLEHLLERWSKTGMPVFLTVLKNNPARRLYERFGFVVIGEVGVKFQMRRTPANAC
ncbi:GNAT family N-acetyltransferase [Tardiphaga sp. OK245]|uniref:GNAT family N-acetyltransferase n=1 Tax=Tardiphaga sp. OK245 TaxID=1855306 RepID=UPI0008A814FF|nr:GNAT family N-acetyltransferase [Tardiphaga sp. OK245]SEI19785.1 L-amino acid N-acyltransferase YncA [Tardiphaga sp. OK245]